MRRERDRIFWSDGAGGIHVVAATALEAPAHRDAGDRMSRTTAALGAALAALALARHGLTREGVLAAGLLPVLAVLAGIDLRCRLLPNRIVLPALAAVLAWQIALAPQRTGEWLAAAVGAAVFLLAPSLLRPGAVGMGDVKLAALLGAALGAEVAGALLIGLMAMAPVALIVLWRRGRDATLPMGPCLAFGAALVLLA
ncbi:MAG: leader peptidase (prepilin peptidase) / N-methyltransferase [Frankiaceae bacterium]|jgi:leader peptidase (prepilin peptidase)/N-methyltransferase|nr:leader peptidase (prepilin peptidase) / N-methyltransferase [Frankiaceae bacterium]